MDTYNAQSIIRYQSFFTSDILEHSNSYTVLSLINAPGALQFFKSWMFIRGKFSMQKCSGQAYLQ